MLRLSLLASLSVVFATAALAEDTSPFPAGENAALVKKTCTECHGASIVVSTQFDEKLARRQYKLFVGDPDSEEGKKIVTYLTTYLGPR